jgi:class 3 adenylate cyclase
VTEAHELLSGTVTLFFTDVEGSTELLRAVGSKQYSAIVDEHREIVRRGVGEHGGREVDSRGEEVFAVFARSTDAVEAAAAIERDHQCAAWPAEAKVRVRIGIHTGAPVVHEGGYLGLDVHRAARICAAGHGGQILLSEATTELLAGAWPDGASAKTLGRYELKGLGEPEQIFQLVAPDLIESFPPLRVASPGRFVAEDHQALGEAAHAAVAPRRAKRRFHRGKRDRLAELAWEARALIPELSESERGPLAGLVTVLFDAARIETDADRFLADVDRKHLDRLLAEYRELALVSKRAQAELEALAGRREVVDAVEARRQRLDELAGEIESALPAAQSIDRLRTEAGELGRELEEARRAIGLLGLKLERTHHHGVYKHGRVFIVPDTDELGIEHYREFGSLHDAVAFKKRRELEAKGGEKLVGAPHDYGVAMQRYLPVRDDRP